MTAEGCWPMTEPDWLACTDPTLMLDFLRDTGKATDRKLRLFAAHCSRRVIHLLRRDPEMQQTDWQEWSETMNNALVLVERFLDGQASREDAENAEFPGPGQDEDPVAWCVSHLVMTCRQEGQVMEQWVREASQEA